MTWRVRYRRGTEAMSESYPTLESAIPPACRLIDAGCEVYAIDADLPRDSIEPPMIARLHAIWRQQQTD